MNYMTFSDNNFDEITALIKSGLLMREVAKKMGLTEESQIEPFKKAFYEIRAMRREYEETLHMHSYETVKAWVDKGLSISKIMHSEDCFLTRKRGVEKLLDHHGFSIEKEEQICDDAFMAVYESGGVKACKAMYKNMGKTVSAATMRIKRLLGDGGPVSTEKALPPIKWPAPKFQVRCDYTNYYVW